MRDSMLTTLCVAAAAGLTAAAYLTRPVPQEVALLSDQGQPLAPDLADVTSLSSLEVLGYDETAAKVRPFKVEKDKSGRWIIPSHSGYPADAEVKMGQAAAAFVGLTKERVVTDSREDHERLGVLDPSDEKSLTTGRGTRVTMRDSTGRAAADLVIGKPVPGEGSKRYVRQADKGRVYVTTMESGFSTTFTDWVETDLLKVGQTEVSKIVSDRFKADSERGALTNVESVTITRLPSPPAASSPQPPQSPAPAWAFTARPGGPPGDGEKLDEARVNELLSALSTIRIAGVRAKPTNLSKMLAGSDGQAMLSVADQMSLQSRGFLITADGRLVSSEGQMLVQTKDGVAYSIWFGDIAVGAEDGAATDAIPAAPDATASAEESSPRKPGGSGDLRYVMVTTSFDETLLPEPTPPPDLPPKPTAPERTPDADNDPNSAKPETPAEDPAVAAKRAEYERVHQEWKAKVEAAKKRAEGLSRRFADWYYVIDGKSFASLRPTRANLVKKADADASSTSDSHAQEKSDGSNPEETPDPVSEFPITPEPTDPPK
ncbi:MAG: DUF4340 domain-containing protein [Phycisphaerae bacterium]|nr:DUF4340 domain-containing protein [Phycisphaerae bacterium]